ADTPARCLGAAALAHGNYTLSLHDALPILKEGRLCGLAAYRRTAAEFSLPLSGCGRAPFDGAPMCGNFSGLEVDAHGKKLSEARSEEHTSELQSRFDLVCRLLLETNKRTTA